MLRYRADLRTLAFVASFFVLVTIGWVFHPAWPLRIPLIIATASVAFFCAVITHNTIHLPIFKQEWLNRVFQVVLTLTYGHPVSAFVPGHNLSHHVHTQTRKDIMRTSKLRFRWNLLNQLFFMPRVSGAITKAEWQYAKAMYRVRPAWTRQLVLESIVFIGLQIFLVVLDWEKFLLYVMIPHINAAWGIVGINFCATRWL